MEAERNQLLVEWNSTSAPYPSEQTIHELFSTQAAIAPEAVAVECDGERLSYAELDRRANQLARCLERLGVGPEVRVGLWLERSIEMVVGALAILKAGGAYVPLDPA
jgi:non-ribosomal peptide synthetase component F